MGKNCRWRAVEKSNSQSSSIRINRPDHFITGTLRKTHLGFVSSVLLYQVVLTVHWDIFVQS